MESILFVSLQQQEKIGCGNGTGKRTKSENLLATLLN
jgi:hypothetical protein